MNSTLLPFINTNPNNHQQNNKNQINSANELQTNQKNTLQNKKLFRFASLANLNLSPSQDHQSVARRSTTTPTTLSELTAPTSARSSKSFDSSTHKPTHHDPTGNGFRNPWPSAAHQPSNSLLNTFLTRGLPLELARKPESESSLRPTTCVPAQLDLYDGFMPSDWKTRRSNKLIATWLGHAGCLVQLPTTSSHSHSKRPFRALFDPMFSARAGPSAYTGPKRLIGSPCRISDLPIVDVCCISHSHYDHLDYETVKELIKLQPHLKFYVPLGLKAWFSTTPVPVKQVIEMDWWDSQFFLSLSPFDEIISSGSSDQKLSTVRINCVPAQHSSGRSLLDQNTSLWCGWVIEQMGEDKLSSSEEEEQGNPKNLTPQRSSVYFAGDTGYRNSLNPDLCCPAFCEIGEKYGPIDFSMIPIWRGGSLSFISWAGLRLADDSLLATHHASPIDAVKIHQEVKSSHSIAIHHGCFVGSSQESFDALQELDKARKELGVGDWMEKGGFGAIDVGVTVEIDV